MPMQHLQFMDAGVDAGNAVVGAYSSELVVASVLISFMAAFVAFNHVSLIRSAGARGAGIIWNAGAAAALAIGVWGMHFVGMLAFELPVPVTYRLDITAVSLVPAFAASLVALKVLAVVRPTSALLVFGGVSMGIGICLMHYIGMAAMVAPVDMYYQPALFIASIAAAVIVATLSLFLRASLDRAEFWPVGVTLVSSIIMGGAISSMHYMAMEATVYLPSQADGQTAGALSVSSSALEWGIVVAVLLVFVVAAVSAYLRRREIRARSAADASGVQVDLLYDQLKTVASRVPGVVYQFRRSPDGRNSFPYASEKIHEVYRVTPEEVVDDAMPVVQVLHPDDRNRVVEEIEESARSLTDWRSRFRVRFPDGSERWLLGNAAPRREDDGTVNWSGFIMDVTAQQEAEATIQRLAYYDGLTGLPNRTFLYERLERSIVRLGRSGQYGALFFIDLDRFKFLNEHLGHSAGDRHLQLVAECLAGTARRDDITARLGGDEFVFAVEGLGTERDLAAVEAERVGCRLLALVRECGEKIPGLGQPTTASIGISLFGGPRKPPRDEIVKRADIAMSAAKERGGDALQFFDREMSDAVAARASLERDLGAALVNDELILHYQRQVDCHGQPVGAEALVRWQHPRQGLLAPDRFIVLAEQIGMIVPLGSWVLQSACAQLSEWRASPATKDLTIAVNVSARQFYRDDFVEEVASALERSAVDPRLLKLEITETLMLHDLADARNKVQLLREIGVRTSIDDFGKGYSSLSYLAQLDVAELKIDRTFIWDLGSARNDKARMIVDAIANLGARLGLTVCAEGVETEQQFDFLKQTGCQCFQGFFFGRPAPASALSERIDG
jgi:diguanylate cyclase (GGDEF)-like protein/PAS domain S-box-containing protein